MIQIRTIRDDELVDYLRTGGMGFLDRTDPVAYADEVRPIWDLARNHAAFDDGRMCGTFRSWASELTVPGASQLPASCIAGVAVVPTHRRRGVLRRLVAAEHAAARERGEAVALLYASEYPIYGRFGYGPATRQATFTLDTRQSAFHPAALAGGATDMVVPDATTRDTLVAIHETWRRRRHGELRRRPQVWDFDIGLRPSVWGTWKGFVAIHRDATGAPDGYARFSVEERWQDRQPRNVIKLDELHALSDGASADLWQFLSHLDWVTSIVAPRRAPSDRLPWTLTNARAAVISESGDSLWVRLLDVPRALTARTYTGEGSLIIEVVDTDVDGAERTRIALDVGPDGASARLTRTAPDVTVAAAVLGAAYLGGTRLGDAAVALGPAGAEEHRPNALATLEAWLRTPDEPWCSTFF
jgi:predicted acetyltransferase